MLCVVFDDVKLHQPTLLVGFDALGCCLAPVPIIALHARCLVTLGRERGPLSHFQTGCMTVDLLGRLLELHHGVFWLVGQLDAPGPSMSSVQR